MRKSTKENNGRWLFLTLRLQSMSDLREILIKCLDPFAKRLLTNSQVISSFYYLNYSPQNYVQLVLCVRRTDVSRHAQSLVEHLHFAGSQWGSRGIAAGYLCGFMNVEKDANLFGGLNGLACFEQIESCWSQTILLELVRLYGSPLKMPGRFLFAKAFTEMILNGVYSDENDKTEVLNVWQLRYTKLLRQRNYDLTRAGAEVSRALGILSGQREDLEDRQKILLERARPQIEQLLAKLRRVILVGRPFSPLSDLIWRRIIHGNLLSLGFMPWEEIVLVRWLQSLAKRDSNLEN